MSDRSTHVCPVEKADGLDNRIRRWLQNPRKILRPYITEGMTVLDVGCGPGLFSIEMARMAGSSGRVIACDLQEGMLRKVREKIQGTDIENRIALHKCEKETLNLSDTVDFVLAFYVVHEVPDKDRLFKEIASLLKPGGLFFIVEPPFHVSKTAMLKTVRKAQDAGFIFVEKPKVFLSKTAVLKKE